MSYPKDLDEYEDRDLRRELERRERLRAQGRCDYCQQEASASPCRFPRRHISATKGGRHG